jgi:hypothetical protein
MCPSSGDINRLMMMMMSANIELQVYSMTYYSPCVALVSFDLLTSELIDRIKYIV